MADDHDNRATCCSYCNTPGNLPSIRTDPEVASLPENRRKYLENDNIPINNRLVECTRCGTCRYCSVKCQIRDWEEHHGNECLYFRYTKERGIASSTTECLVLRMYSMAKADTVFLQQLLSLTSHAENILSGSSFVALRQEAFDISSHLNGFYDNSLPLDFNTLACLSFVNSTVMQNTFMESNGQMFDPTFALVNHGCDPNVGVIFEGREVTLKAIKKISSGGELLVNYCVIGLPAVLRNQDLEDRFCFRCKCKLCMEKYDRFMSINCPNCGSLVGGYNFQGYSAPRWEMVLKSDGRCKNCKAEISKTAISEAEALVATLFSHFLLDLKGGSSETAGGNDWSVVQVDISQKDLVSYLMQYDFGHSFQIKAYESAQFYGSCLKAITLNKLVPSYAYPLPFILIGLRNFYSHREHVSAEVKSSDPNGIILDSPPASESSVPLVLASTSFALATVFKADIPCNVALYKLGLGNQLREVTEVLCSLLHADTPGINANGLLTKVAYIFALESYAYLVRDFTGAAPVVRQVEALILELKQRMTFPYYLPSDELYDWFMGGLSPGESTKLSRDLLEKFDIMIPINGKIRFSDRNAYSLFKAKDK